MGTDPDYFLARAEEEEERAAATDDELAKDAHRRLAELYRYAAQNRGPRTLDDHRRGLSHIIIR